MPEWQKLAAGWKEGGAGCSRAVAIGTQRRARLVRLAHDHCGHIGAERVTWTLRQNFTWPGMHKQIKAHCQQCDSCQKARRGKERKIPMGEMPLLTKP